MCGVDITEEEFAEEYEHLLPYLMLVDSQGEEQVTYFEALTALAYLWFADKPVGARRVRGGDGRDLGRDEPGPGDVAVLTPIALDHPELGFDGRRGGGGEGGHHQGGRRRDRAASRTTRRCA